MHGFRSNHRFLFFSLQLLTPLLAVVAAQLFYDEGRGV